MLYLSRDTYAHILLSEGEDTFRIFIFFVSRSFFSLQLSGLSECPTEDVGRQVVSYEKSL
jgi:hypothetical protein